MRDRHLSVIFGVLLVALMASCGGAGTFSVKGHLGSEVNTNLYLKYYGNDAVQTVVTAANAGEFEAKGRTKDPAVVEILDNEHRILGIFYAGRGDKIDITIDRNNRFNNQIKGNEVNERLSQVFRSNAAMLQSGDKTNINNFIEQYIKSNPKDPVGSILFASLYDASSDPVHADEVMELIAPEARIASVLDSYAMLASASTGPEAFKKVENFRYRPLKGDSVRTFDPSSRDASLLVISDEKLDRKEQVVTRIREIYKAHPSSRLQILEFALYNDTIQWKSALRRDSAEWIEAWVPGGLLADGLDRLAVPTIPYYIVCDAEGRQTYRGTSPDDASAAIRRLIEGKR